MEALARSSVPFDLPLPTTGGGVVDELLLDGQTGS